MYYSKLYDDYIKEYSFVYLETTDNYDDYFNDNKLVSKFEKIIAFNVDNINLFVSDVRINEVDCERFLSDNDLLLFKDSSLSENEIIIGNNYYFENQLLNETSLGLEIYDITYKLKVIKTIETKYLPVIYVSEKLYDELLPKKDEYVYYVFTDKYSSSKKIINDLEKKNIYNKVALFQISTEDDVKNLLFVIRISLFVSISIFLIIGIIFLFKLFTLKK